MLEKATEINPGYAFAYYVKSLALCSRSSSRKRSRPPRRPSLSIPMRPTGISRWAKRKSIWDAANNQFARGNAARAETDAYRRILHAHTERSTASTRSKSWPKPREAAATSILVSSRSFEVRAHYAGGLSVEEIA